MSVLQVLHVHSSRREDILAHAFAAVPPHKALEQVLQGLREGGGMQQQQQQQQQQAGPDGSAVPWERPTEQSEQPGSLQQGAGSDPGGEEAGQVAAAALPLPHSPPPCESTSFGGGGGSGSSGLHVQLHQLSAVLLLRAATAGSGGGAAGRSCSEAQVIAIRNAAHCHHLMGLPPMPQPEVRWVGVLLLGAVCLCMV